MDLSTQQRQGRFYSWCPSKSRFQHQRPFFRHNQELIETVERLEAKTRRLDLLVDEDTIQVFYEGHIPSGIASGPAFERWLRDVSRHDPSCYICE